MLISGSKLSAIGTFLSRDLISEELRWCKKLTPLTWLLVGVLIMMENTFPIEKSRLFSINFNENSGHFIFFGLQGNAGGTGAEGKPVSLGLVQKVWLYPLTSEACVFFFLFCFCETRLVNRENLDRGATSARMDREVPRQVENRRSRSNY